MGNKLLPPIFPAVAKIIEPNIFGRQEFSPIYPLGVTIHHAADRDLERVIRSLKESGNGYHMLIDRDGSFVQTAFFERTVDHAGKAKWNGKSPNRAHIAVSVLSWGRLSDKLKSWSGALIDPKETAERPDVNGNLALWDKATEAQERSLITFLTWCVSKGISPDDICGHDECCLPHGRKDDPGGVLSLTMSKLRTELKAKLILN